MVPWKFIIEIVGLVCSIISIIVLSVQLEKISELTDKLSEIKTAKAVQDKN